MLLNVLLKSSIFEYNFITKLPCKCENSDCSASSSNLLYMLDGSREGVSSKLATKFGKGRNSYYIFIFPEPKTLGIHLMFRGMWPYCAGKTMHAHILSCSCLYFGSVPVKVTLWTVVM